LSSPERLHFVTPKTYIAMMPRYLPAHANGLRQRWSQRIAGGVGLMHPRTRVWAGRWLMATLAAVFPANLNMAVNPSATPRTSPAARRR